MSTWITLVLSITLACWALVPAGFSRDPLLDEGGFGFGFPWDWIATWSGVKPTRENVIISNLISFDFYLSFWWKDRTWGASNIKTGSLSLQVGRSGAARIPVQVDNQSRVAYVITNRPTQQPETDVLVIDMTYRQCSWCWDRFFYSRAVQTTRPDTRPRVRQRSAAVPCAEVPTACCWSPGCWDPHPLWATSPTPIDCLSPSPSTLESTTASK